MNRRDRDELAGLLEELRRLKYTLAVQLASARKDRRQERDLAYLDGLRDGVIMAIGHVQAFLDAHASEFNRSS